MICPKCGGLTHRSRTRGLNERLVKTFTSRKTYRCSECGWRGWIRGTALSKRPNTLRTFISVIVTLLITTLLALYVVEKLSMPTPGAGSQEEQSPQ